MKDILQQAGVDTDSYSSLSTRSVRCPAAGTVDANLGTVLKAAGWNLGTVLKVAGWNLGTVLKAAGRNLGTVLKAAGRNLGTVLKAAGWTSERTFI